LLKRDKVNLDIFWLRDESLEDSADLADPDVLALEIAEELEPKRGKLLVRAENVDERARLWSNLRRLRKI
jgi:type I restriction enzyme M protein